MKPFPTRDAGLHGLSLMELVVVVAVLGITTGLITHSLNPNTLAVEGVGQGQTPPMIATRTTMKVMKEAVLGASGRPGYWEDMGKVNRAFPQFTAALFTSPSNVVAAAPLSLLGSSVDAQWYKDLLAFNPRTGKGWRGPYLTAQGGTYPFTTAAVDRLFTSDFCPPGLAWVPVPLDGWGNPIVIQWGSTVGSDSPINARLISAGPDGVLDCNSSRGRSLLTYQDFVNDRAPGGNRYSGDDLVTFFFFPDPQ